MPKSLLADNGPHIREVLNRLLTKEGHEVIEAENGSAALEAAYDEHPDLIFLDVMMPVMDGNGTGCHHFKKSGRLTRPKPKPRWELHSQPYGPSAGFTLASV